MGTLAAGATSCCREIAPTGKNNKNAVWLVNVAKAFPSERREESSANRHKTQVLVETLQRRADIDFVCVSYLHSCMLAGFHNISLSKILVNRNPHKHKEEEVEEEADQKETMLLTAATSR